MSTLIDINGQTRILGLIGTGISYTLSPLIHNYSIEFFKLNQIYLPFDIQNSFPDQDFFKVMWDIGAVGFNVTVPWKEMAALSFKDPSYSSINTIYRGQEAWQVASTDGPGFEKGLARIGLSIGDFEQIVFLGNGGAALGIHQHLVMGSHLQKHVVLRRDSKRDSKWLEGKIEVELKEFNVNSLIATLQNQPNSLVIQCTNAPMNGFPLSEFDEALNLLQGGFVDLLYKKPSSLLAKARELGIPAQDGLGMLIGQALLAQELWWGRSMNFEDVEQILLHKINSV